MLIFQIKRIISSEKWFNYVVTFFFFFENAKNLGRSDDAKRGKKKEDGLTSSWARTLKHVNFNHVNKIYERYKVLRLIMKLSEFLLLCLRATFDTLPLFYLRT